MENHRGEEKEELDRLFHALSDRSRRYVLARLAQEGPLTVGELRKPLGLAKSTVSKHLGVLEQAGLLRRSVLGRYHTCRLQPKALIVAQRWLGRTAVKDMRRRRGA